MTFDHLNLMLADQVQLAPNPTGMEIKTFAPLIIIFVVMYVLMILPQQKKTKELAATLKSLKPGDKVVTGSGLIGIVLSIKDRTVSIRSAESKLEILKSAITEVTERSGEVTEAKS